MNEAAMLELIKGRRSVRHFSAKQLTPETLKTLVEAAVWAPSGSNAQAWEFVVLDHEDGELMRRMIAFLPGVTEPPAAMIWLCLDQEKERQKAGKLGLEVMGIMDISMAAQNIMLQAHAMGLASCAVGSFNADVTRIALGLPEQIAPILLLLLGEPRQPGFGPPRPPVENNIHWHQYGNREEPR